MGITVCLCNSTLSTRNVQHYPPAFKGLHLYMTRSKCSIRHWFLHVWHQSRSPLARRPPARGSKSWAGHTDTAADESQWRSEIVYRHCWSPLQYRQFTWWWDIGNILSSGRKIASSLLRLNIIGSLEAASRVRARDSRWTASQTSGASPPYLSGLTSANCLEVGLILKNVYFHFNLIKIKIFKRLIR